MAFEQRELSGSLFKNDRKEEEKQPDYTGGCKIGGTEYWISGWVKPGKDGKKSWLSLAFTEKKGGTLHQSSPVGASLGEDDDIPF